MRIGSYEHKELFCRSFINSHEPYEPKELAWPQLDDRTLEILRSVPVWSTALQVEVNAGEMIRGFASTQTDPLITQALRLQGYEEDRHGRMLTELIQRYGLEAQVEPPQQPPTREAFINFGYDECVDSFLGFGVFGAAREVKFVPDALLALFTRVIWEEARHIVFFVNWISYERAIRGYGATPLQIIPTAIGYARALKRTLGRAGSTNTQDRGMAAAGDIFKGLTLPKFLRTCLNENDGHMSRFDPELLKPRVIPTIARTVLDVVELGASVQNATRSILAGT